MGLMCKFTVLKRSVNNALVYESHKVDRKMTNPPSPCISTQFIYHIAICVISTVTWLKVHSLICMLWLWQTTIHEVSWSSAKRLRLSDFFLLYVIWYTSKYLRPIRSASQESVRFYSAFGAASVHRNPYTSPFCFVVSPMTCLTFNVF